MPLENILQRAKQQREDALLAQRQVEQAKLEVEEQKRAIARNEFAATVYEHVGDILRELDGEEPVVIDRDGQTVDFCSNLCCTVQIYHVVIKFGITCAIKGKPKDWLVRTHVSKDYSVYERFIPPSISIDAFVPGREAVRTSELHDFLMLLIFNTKEEYDRLLPEFQAASAKLVQEETTERLLAEYRQAIKEAVEKSNQEIAVLKTILKEWQWPEGRQLKLYKITWAKHGFLDSNGEAHFDYEFGWALSDLPRSFTGYYELLPERNKTAREVKPGYPVTVECYYFTEDTLPEELLEKATQQIDILKVRDHIFDDWERVLPQFLPELPLEIVDKFAIEPKTAIFDLPVPPQPCFEIRQALSEPISDGDNELF